ncbi:hypothetical protein LXL04_013066 [Taraxacum kok-saghyz]
MGSVTMKAEEISVSQFIEGYFGEYLGAVLGVLSAMVYGRKGHIWKEISGLFAMLASFYFFSQGWATAAHSPFYILSLIILRYSSYYLFGNKLRVYHICSMMDLTRKYHLVLAMIVRTIEDNKTHEILDMKSMIAPIFAGIL